MIFSTPRPATLPVYPGSPRGWTLSTTVTNATENSKLPWRAQKISVWHAVCADRARFWPPFHPRTSKKSTIFFNGVPPKFSFFRLFPAGFFLTQLQKSWGARCNLTRHVEGCPAENSKMPWRGQNFLFGHGVFANRPRFWPSFHRRTSKNSRFFFNGFPQKCTYFGGIRRRRRIRRKPWKNSPP